MKNFLGKLPTWSYLTLLKIYYWVQRSAFKKALDLQKICILVLDSEIRILEPSLLQLGEIDGDDALVEYVSRTLTQRQMIPEVENAAHLRSEFSCKLIDRCRTASSTCEAISTFFLTDAFVATLLKDENRKDSTLNNARQFVHDAQPLDASNIYKTHAKLKKRLWVIRAELAERSAIKLDIHVSDLTGLIGIVSALFVISGFLYTRILLGAFGIDVSLFFSLTDYLAASIEQLRYAAISSAIGIVVFVFGMRHGSMRSRFENELLSAQRKREGRWISFFLIITAMHIAWGQYINTPLFDEMLLLGVVGSYWIAGKISKMFFVRPLPALVSFIALFTFATNFGVSIYRQVHDLNIEKWNGRDSLKISFKRPLPVAPSSLVMIAANNNYIFALSKENKLAYVIPRDDLSLVEITKRELSVSGSK